MSYADPKRARNEIERTGIIIAYCVDGRRDSDENQTGDGAIPMESGPDRYSIGRDNT